MLPLLRSLTARYLLQKWDRSVLVVLSIALGVAMLVSTRLLSQYIDAAAYDTTIPVDVADLYVTAGEAGVRGDVADKLRAANIPGLKRVEPFVYERVQLSEIDDRWGVVFGVPINATNPGDLQGLKNNGLSIVSVGDPFRFVDDKRRARIVAVSRRIYELRQQKGRTDTDPVLLQHTNAVESFELAAIIDVAKDSPFAPFADSFVLMDVYAAAQMTRKSKDGMLVTRINLFLDDKARTAEVQAEVAKIVGNQSQVRTPEENRKSTDDLVGGVKTILTLCSLGALVVGLFLVYNALSVTVAERRHDIGIMRSLGATRTQIAWLFSVEAMVLGAIGAFPGIPLGIALSNLAINQFGNELNSVFLKANMPRPSLSVVTGAIAVFAGIITSLLAALVPALQAASDEPADAVRRAPSGSAGRVRIIHRSACIALVVAGLVVFAFRHDLPRRSGSMGSMSLILIGLFLAMPIFVRLMARLIHPICRAVFGVEARLAADNLVRSPARTGVVIGALAAGVSMMFQTAGVSRSNEVPVHAWLQQVLQADAYIFRGNLASANSSMAPMEASVRAELQALPGVERVVGFRFKRLEFRSTFILVIGIDALDYSKGVRSRMPEGLPRLELFDRLPDGDVTIVSENFAAKWNVKEGDTITVQGSRGHVDLLVIGIGQDYSWSQGTIFLDRSKYADLFDDPLIDSFHVFLRQDMDHATSYETVRQHAEKSNLLMQDRASVYLYLAGVIDRIFRVAYLQQFMVAVVAVLGVVMALLISVLQRRRELGLLRAVGATQPQVVKSVLAEAMLMGIVGTVLGFLMGLPMEWYLLHVVLREESGFVFEMLIPWREALGIGVICVLSSTLAGLFPAIHAVRLRIPDAIAYE